MTIANNYNYNYNYLCGVEHVSKYKNYLPVFLKPIDLLGKNWERPTEVLLGWADYS